MLLGYLNCTGDNPIMLKPVFVLAQRTPNLGPNCWFLFETCTTLMLERLFRDTWFMKLSQIAPLLAFCVGAVTILLEKCGFRPRFGVHLCVWSRQNGTFCIKFCHFRLLLVCVFGHSGIYLLVSFFLFFLALSFSIKLFSSLNIQISL